LYHHARRASYHVNVLWKPFRRLGQNFGAATAPD
jgi:hypothetical protein